MSHRSAEAPSLTLQSKVSPNKIIQQQELCYCVERWSRAYCFSRTRRNWTGEIQQGTWSTRGVWCWTRECLTRTSRIQTGEKHSGKYRIMWRYMNMPPVPAFLSNLVKLIVGQLKMNVGQANDIWVGRWPWLMLYNFAMKPATLKIRIFPLDTSTSNRPSKHQPSHIVRLYHIWLRQCSSVQQLCYERLLQCLPNLPVAPLHLQLVPPNPRGRLHLQ